ncbi:MAG: MBL fold metallo-hydrolase, partial [Proteobacteria bacterium]|nr:MBL fold metallo-hydrolase [Pseudomonadota bacterium]
MKIVRIPVPTPFLVGPVNAYLIVSETPTLVDCGPLTEDAWEVLVAGIEGAGCRLDRLQRLVLTHAHIDHAGLANRLRQASGCEVLAHPVDHAALCDVSGAWESSVVDFLVEACRRAGTPSSSLRALERQLA